MNYTLPKNILRRGKTYSVRFDVPIATRSAVGKKQIVKSLGTSDLGEALAKRDPVLREIQASLIGGGNYNNVPKTRTNPKPKRSPTVRQTTKRWQTESDGICGSSLNRYRGILEAFEVYSGNIEVTKIDRQLALDFIRDLQTTLSPKTGELRAHRTVEAYQICLSSYWRVLDHWGYVDPNMRNPFSSLLRRVAGQKVKHDPRRKNLRSVTRDEAEALLAYIASNDRLKYQSEMYLIVRLLWVTGYRLGEICKLTDITDKGDHIVLNIRDAKTEGQGQYRLPFFIRNLQPS